ncbi:DEAD2 domain protein, partial [Ostertagia ostertagi]
MVRMEQDNILTASAKRFVTNALDAVRVRFVASSQLIVTSNTHLSKEDDVMAKIKDQLPSDQMGMMVESSDAFQVLLSKQKNMKPFGDLILKLNSAEDPADNFVYLRDYVDCVNCSKLPEFAPAKLKNGFTEDMRIAALNKLKITKRQSRRVYEILRLKCTNMKDAAEAKAYRLDVKRRLEAPMRRNERDWKKIQRALDDNEYAQGRMDEFSFPFPPYNIQLDLMREIKQCIEKGQVGIFESPTGTGKSLSVLCATMTWLEEFEKKTEEDLLKQSRLTEEVSDNEDWILAHKKKLEIMKIKDEAYDKLQLLEKVKEKLYQAKAGVIKRDRKRRLRDEGNSEELEPENDAAQPLKAVKVFYASRTHSQLEQLMDELKKTRFSPRVVTAASRQTLCVNEDVKRLKFSHLINERCMELRKGCALEGKRVKLDLKENPSTVKKAASKCPYYRGDAIEELSNEILASALCRTSEFSFLATIGFHKLKEEKLSRVSVEKFQVVDRGKELLGCPYFSTRLSLPLCQLVLLPYQVHFSLLLGLTEVNLFKIVHYMESTDMCRKFHGFFIRSMKSRVSVSQSSTSKSGIGKLMAAKKL